MEHFIDIYNKKKYGPSYCEDLLSKTGIKINLKVDGKPFQVLYNEETDQLEWHGRSGNETTIGPLIDDYTRLFSKPVNDAIEHIEPRKDVFKKYKFLTFEVIDNALLLTAVIDKNDNFINDASEIKKIADKLDTDVMPTLWEGQLSKEQQDSILQIISTGVVPAKQDFINWVKQMFGTYKAFPTKLISVSDEFIEGVVLFFDVDGKIIEYKIVDPTYRQSMKDRDAAHEEKRKQLAEYYEKAYNTLVNWLYKNAKKLDSNHIVSMQKNFIELSKDSCFNELIKTGKHLEKNISTTYTIQFNRTLHEINQLSKEYGDGFNNILELYLKTFYKEKKRAFIISPEFQQKINLIVDKMKNDNVKETLSIYIQQNTHCLADYITEAKHSKFEAIYKKFQIIKDKDLKLYLEAYFTECRPKFDMKIIEEVIGTGKYADYESMAMTKQDDIIKLVLKFIKKIEPEPKIIFKTSDKEKNVYTIGVYTIDNIYTIFHLSNTVDKGELGEMYTFKAKQIKI